LAVTIVVDTHHESAAQAHESDNGLQPAAIGPEIHDPNLGLRRSVGSFDGGFKGDSLLEEV